MSETSRPPVQGQIETPNPLELFWEKNKLLVIGVAVVIAAVIAGDYGWKKIKQAEIDRVWKHFAVTTNLDQGYREELGSFPLQPQWYGFYIQMAHNALVTQVAKDVEDADDGELTQAIADAAGQKTEPLLRWVAAVRAARAGEHADARQRLSELETKFPDHFLCKPNPYPLQHLRAKDSEKKKGKDEPAKGAKGEEKPDLEDPVAGSAVSLLVAQLDRQEAFQREHGSLYQPPTPDEKPTVVVKLDSGEEFKIRFYRDKARAHVDSFLERVRSEFYNGQHIDEVQRRPESDNIPDRAPVQMHIGLLAAKSQDRSTWTPAKGQPSAEQLDFEDNDLSHFPGMVSAATEPAPSDKSSGERIWINANECAWRFDGERVVFARVVEGLDVVTEICSRPFEDENQRLSGSGKLEQNVMIASMTIIYDLPPSERNTGTKGEDGPSKGGEAGAKGKGGTKGSASKGGESETQKGEKKKG